MICLVCLVCLICLVCLVCLICLFCLFCLVCLDCLSYRDYLEHLVDLKKHPGSIEKTSCEDLGYLSYRDYLDYFDYLFEGVAKSRKTLSIGARERHREGSPYARLTCTHAGACRASLASKWVTATPPMQRAARRPHWITHISNEKSTFFFKTANSRFKT